MNSTQTSYDQVAEEYAQQYFDELSHKPRDRELLERFAKMVKGKGRVCDIGCGPGQIARYVRDHAADASGLDLSPQMVEMARRLNPGMEFQQGDMRALPFEDGTLAGITAFYSLIHLPRAEVTGALKEFRRVLEPGGMVLLSFHRGDFVRHVDEFFNKPVSLDFAFFEPDEMTGYLMDAGFQVDEVIERAPYPDVEYPSQRVYIFASKTRDSIV